MYANDRPSCFSSLWQTPSSRKSTSPTSVSFILLVYSSNRDEELHIWPLYRLNKYLRLRRPSTDILFEGYRSALGTQKVRPLLIERSRDMFTDTKSTFHSCRNLFPGKQLLFKLTFMREVRLKTLFTNVLIQTSEEELKRRGHRGIIKRPEGYRFSFIVSCNDEAILNVPQKQEISSWISSLCVYINEKYKITHCYSV